MVICHSGTGVRRNPPSPALLPRLCDWVASYSPNCARHIKWNKTRYLPSSTADLAPRLFRSVRGVDLCRFGYVLIAQYCVTNRMGYLLIKLTRTQRNLIIVIRLSLEMWRGELKSHWIHAEVVTCVEDFHQVCPYYSFIFESSGEHELVMCYGDCHHKNIVMDR